jgi:oligopeptide transport system substrate-binding protein
MAAPAISNERNRRPATALAGLLLMACLLASVSCNQLKQPEPEPYFAQSPPPAVQEFRWSNGNLPKSLDPAMASAPPETDVVRALYEGLTETDPATMKEVPGVAESWSAAEDNRVWTFTLRENARWSNGKPVTAGDFVRAWKRIVKLGDKTAHRGLLRNIAGVPEPVDSESAVEPSGSPLDPSGGQPPLAAPLQRLAANPKQAVPEPGPKPDASPPPTPGKPAENGPAIEAVDDRTLKISLKLPDPDLPKLVAHPIFRPIFSNGEEFMGRSLSASIVTNGPFRLVEAGPGGLLLERSDQYWNREKVALERVRIVAMENSEKALSAYRAGELDAVTNASITPLVLKLLTPYEDFRKTTHSALNLYEVNVARAPFSDRRVREALSSSIERERLTEGEMEGLARPALSFMALRSGTRRELAQDKERAKELLDEAGFPEGEGFPVVRLLVNRNDLQQRVARAVARMWKQNLNIETEIIVREPAELETARRTGDFDIVRRGLVFPTADETANLRDLFGYEVPVAASTPRPDANVARPEPTVVPGGSPTPSPSPPGLPPITTEEEAFYELRAIPLYFPTSFSLVKPYVRGFEMNSLDIHDLSLVTIDSEWNAETSR